MTMAPPRRRRSERGAVGGVEVLPLALLIFVAGALLLVDAWAVLDAKLAVGHAAREAGRAYVEAPDDAIAPARAVAAGRAAFAGAGHDPTHLQLVEQQAPWQRCAGVEITARTSVRTIRLPFVGSFGPPLTVSATHREVLDPYRSGLPGSSSCA